MNLPTFPLSPLPANVQRTPQWNTNKIAYDSGASQAMTPWQRPLMQWAIPFNNIPVTKQSSLYAFWNDRRGQTDPFLMKDPYDYQVSSVLAVASGVSSGAFSLYDIRSYFVIADSFSVASLFSTLSGYVRLGSDYVYDQDTGVFSIVTKATSDVWSARNFEFFRKCRFDADYADQSPFWQQFSVALVVKEIV